MSEISPDQVEERELVRRIGMGDPESFAEFYDRCVGILYATVYRVLNDPTDAEDVTQEVFIMIWDKAAMYDASRGNPLTWAITMARNKAIDRLRSLQRRSRLRDQVEEEMTMEDLTQERRPFDELDHQEKGRLLKSAVMKLTTEQRQVIEMAYFSGLTQNEIAEQLREPLGTVKARMRRGMMKLRKMIPQSL